MMLMGLIPFFWLEFVGLTVPLPTVQKLGLGYQAAKRADAADGHAGTLLLQELLPEKVSTGLEGLVLSNPSRPRANQRSSTVLPPAIHCPYGVTSALSAIAEAKNRPTTETQNYRNAERGLRNTW